MLVNSTACTNFVIAVPTLNVPLFVNDLILGNRNQTDNNFSLVYAKIKKKQQTKKNKKQ